jgi:hypothetical protein
MRTVKGIAMGVGMVGGAVGMSYLGNKYAPETMKMVAGGLAALGGGATVYGQYALHKGRQAIAAGQQLGQQAIAAGNEHIIQPVMNYLNPPPPKPMGPEHYIGPKLDFDNLPPQIDPPIIDPPKPMGPDHFIGPKEDFDNKPPQVSPKKLKRVKTAPTTTPQPEPTPGLGTRMMVKVINGVGRVYKPKPKYEGEGIEFKRDDNDHIHFLKKEVKLNTEDYFDSPLHEEEQISYNIGTPPKRLNSPKYDEVPRYSVKKHYTRATPQGNYEYNEVDDDFVHAESQTDHKPLSMTPISHEYQPNNYHRPLAMTDIMSHESPTPTSRELAMGIAINEFHQMAPIERPSKYTRYDSVDIERPIQPRTYTRYEKENVSFAPPQQKQQYEQRVQKRFLEDLESKRKKQLTSTTTMQRVGQVAAAGGIGLATWKVGDMLFNHY